MEIPLSIEVTFARKCPKQIGIWVCTKETDVEQFALHLRKQFPTIASGAHSWGCSRDSEGRAASHFADLIHGLFRTRRAVRRPQFFLRIFRNTILLLCIIALHFCVESPRLYHLSADLLVTVMATVL